MEFADQIRIYRTGKLVLLVDGDYLYGNVPNVHRTMEKLATVAIRSGHCMRPPSTHR